MYVHSKAAFLLLSITILLQCHVLAQSDSLTTYYLDDIIISANRVPTEAAAVGTSYTVITKEEIRNSGKTLLLSLLEGLPGMSLSQQGGPGKLASLFSRGGSAGYTLVLIDGVKMNMPNDPGNIFDFAALSTDNIERIEILRGPQSTLYGSEALTGVVNIITEKAGAAPGIRLRTEAGRYATLNGSGGITGYAGKFKYELNANRFSTEGFSSAAATYGNTENDGSAFTNFSGRISRQFGEGETASLLLFHGKGSADFDQWGGANGDDPTYFYNFEQNGAAITYANQPEERPLHLSASVSTNRNIRWYGFDSTLYNNADSRSRYDGSSIRAGVQATWFGLKQHTITVGTEFERQQATSDYYYHSSFGPYVSKFPANYTYSTGIFAQEQFSWHNTLFLTGGARLEGHRNYGWIGTFRAAASYVVRSIGVKFKGSAATGFKAPSLFYLYDPAFGNRDLNPERNFGWDFGIESPLGNLAVAELTWFSNRFKNLFGFDSAFRTVNVSSARTNGAEFALHSATLLGIGLTAAYTFLESMDHSSGADYRMPLLRRPRHKGTLELNYSGVTNLNINLSVNASGRRDEKDFALFPAKRYSAPGYTVYNAAAAYQLLDFAAIYARIENIFNANYEEVPGYGTAGRSLYAGVRLGM